MGLEGGEPGPAPRRVRSFVRREGRVTRGQRRALERLGERYLLPDDGGRIDAEELFGRRAPLIIEIGCGNGDNLLARAAACPVAQSFASRIWPGGSCQCIAKRALGSFEM